MSPKREGKPRREAITEILESRWDEGQAHLAGAGVELLLALRVAVSVPIDVSELRSEGGEEDGKGEAAGWRLLRELIDAAVRRLRKLGDDPSRAIKRETLATVQDALAKEIGRLEEGALGKDAAILAQTFRSVKAIIDRQMELLGPERRPKGRQPRRARKVKVE